MAAAGAPPRLYRDQGLVDRKTGDILQRPASSPASSFKERDGTVSRNLPKMSFLHEERSFSKQMLPTSPSSKLRIRRSTTMTAPFPNEPFWNACKHGNMPIVLRLLAMDDPSSSPELGDDELWILMNSERPSDGTTPLFAAAVGGHIPVLKLLLSLGVEMFPRNDGASPFYIACLMDNASAANLIFHAVGRAAGSTVERRRQAQAALLTSRTLKEGWTPLLAAASRGSLDVVTYLCTKSRLILDPFSHRRLCTVRDARGHSAAALARRRSHSKCAAVVEWNLRKRGSALGDKPGESSAYNGSTLFLANKGRWAEEVDLMGAAAATPEDSGFKLDTTPRGRISNLHDKSTAFGQGPSAQRQRPRKLGGIATTFHLDDVIGGKDDGDSFSFDESNVGERRSAFSLKGNVTNAMEVGDPRSLPKSHALSHAQRALAIAQDKMGSRSLERASYEYALAAEQFSTAVACINADLGKGKSPNGSVVWRRSLMRLRAEAEAGNRLSRKMAIHCRQALQCGGVPNLDALESEVVCGGGWEDMEDATERAFTKRVQQKTQPWWAEAEQPRGGPWYMKSEIDEAEQPGPSRRSRRIVTY